MTLVDHRHASWEQIWRSYKHPHNRGKHAEHNLFILLRQYMQFASVTDLYFLSYGIPKWTNHSFSTNKAIKSLSEHSQDYWTVLGLSIGSIRGGMRLCSARISVKSVHSTPLKTAARAIFRRLWWPFPTWQDPPEIATIAAPLSHI